MKIQTLTFLAALAIAGSAQAQPSIDSNNDGRLTLPEFLAGRSAPMMQRMDANHDGRITQAEQQAMRGQRQAATPQGKAPPRKGDGERRGPGGGGGMMAMLDANKDGAVTRAEMDGAMTQRFRAADADKNGWLSLTEFQGMRGPGGGGPRNN